MPVDLEVLFKPRIKDKLKFDLAKQWIFIQPLVGYHNITGITTKVSQDKTSRT